MQDYQISAIQPWKAAQFVGGHLACDFVNTLSTRVESEKAIERFSDADHVESWCRSVGINLSVSQGWLAEGELANLLKVRERGFQLLKTLTETGDLHGSALAVLLKETAAGMAQLQLSVKEGQSLNLTGVLVSSSQSLAAYLTLHILDLLYTADSKRVRSCPRCGWIFYDQSKSGRRRWCDMKVCGNREKARKFYRSRIRP